MILGAAQIAGGLISGISGRRAGKKSSEMQKRLGAIQQAEYGKQITAETENRIETKATELNAKATRLGTIQGMYEKSGLLMTGTPGKALKEQRENFDYNIEQGDEASIERARQIKVQARVAAMSSKARADAYSTQGDTDAIAGGFMALKGGLNFTEGMNSWLGNPGQADPDRGGDNFWNNLGKGKTVGDLSYLLEGFGE